MANIDLMETRAFEHRPANKAWIIHTIRWIFSDERNIKLRVDEVMTDVTIRLPGDGDSVNHTTVEWRNFRTTRV